MSDPRVSSLMREREESSDVRRSTTSGFQTGNVIWILFFFYFYDRDTRRADRNRWAGRKLTNTSRWRSWTAPCQPLVVWSVKPNGIAIDPFRLLIPAVRSIVCWRKTTTFSPVNTPIGGKLQSILLFVSKFLFDFHFFLLKDHNAEIQRRRIDNDRLSDGSVFAGASPVAVAISLQRSSYVDTGTELRHCGPERTGRRTPQFGAFDQVDPAVAQTAFLASVALRQRRRVPGCRGRHSDPRSQEAADQSGNRPPEAADRTEFPAARRTAPSVAFAWIWRRKCFLFSLDVLVVVVFSFLFVSCPIIVRSNRWAATRPITAWSAEAARHLLTGAAIPGGWRPPPTRLSCDPSTTFCERIAITSTGRGAPAAGTCTTTATRRQLAATCRTALTRAAPVRLAAIRECRRKRSGVWSDWRPPSAPRTTRAASTSGCTISLRWPATRSSASAVTITQVQRPCPYCRTCPADRASCWRIWPPAPTMRPPCTFSHEASTERTGRTVPRAICRRADPLLPPPQTKNKRQ